MLIRTLAGGLATAIIFGVANGALSIYSPWNLTSLLVWFVLPIGAGILGFLGALGAGFAAKSHSDGAGAGVVLWGLVFGALTVVINYFTIYQFQIYPVLLHHPDVSFFAFLNQYFASFTLGDVGESSSESGMGSWGVLMGWSDFVAGAIGGFIGAAWGSGQSEAATE